jgi:hypothetical protein
MKKKSVNKGSCMALLSIAGVMLLSSCQSTSDALSSRKNRQTQGDFEPVTFKTVVKSEIIPLNPAPGYEGPRMLIIMTIQNIPSRGKLGDLIKNSVFGGIDSEAYGEKVIADYRLRYQEEGKGAPTEGGAPSASWNWEYSETVEGTVITLERTLSGMAGCFIVCRSREYYLGGAHGMREKQYFLFDTAKMRKLNLDDLIRKNARMTLRQIFADKLRERMGIGKDVPLSQGGFLTDLPEVPENFFLTPDGFGFHWDPYEVGPYVMGPIDVIIPYDELMNVLR